MSINKIKTMDTIFKQLDLAVDLDSTKKMLAFQYFNNDINALAEYLRESNYLESNTFNFIEPRAQLELSF
tara:strand:- start:190 stop:399 length:210 start_codon:yes stop_codon:yes gene_type:complete